MRAVQVEAFAAWRRFFEALAEDGPTVLVFEDIHWADDALLDFIDLLADRAGAVALLIVCTARPELLERREHWAGGKTNATHDLAHTAVRARTPRGWSLHCSTRHCCPPRCNRHCSNARKAIRSTPRSTCGCCKTENCSSSGEGGWTLTGQADDLPESIQGIIAARLDTLTIEQKTFIQDASVIGKTAWIGAVCALTTRSTWEAEELLHSLERKQLLQRVRHSSIDGEAEFNFDACPHPRRRLLADPPL